MKATVKKIVFNRNISQFSVEQQAFVNSELSRFMHIFGYAGTKDHEMDKE